MNIAEAIAEKIMGQKETSTETQPIWDKNKTMHCLIWNGKKDIEYVEHARPCVTDPTDILLRITATTICGSDLHLFKGSMPGMQKGDIPGHEFMGIIEEVGSEVKKLKVGQRVVVAFDIACGQCAYCKREEYTACDTTCPSRVVEKMYGHRPAALYGYSHLTGGVPGGQAEYVRVAFADINCLPIPDDIPDEKALFLSDVVPTAYHGCMLGEVKKGCSVGIWGLGPIGLMAARWCQILGAAKVIGIDCVPERLRVAQAVLGIDVINFKENDVIKTMQEMTNGELDVAIECAGFDYSNSLMHKVEMAVGLETDTSEIFAEMFHVVRKFGRVAVIGVYSGYANHFPVGAMMEKDLIVKCGQSPTQKYWKMCIEKIQSGELDPTFIISDRGHLSDGPRLYNKFNDKEGGCIKVFMRPGCY
uniref:Alcohol dehydrogenase-like C-terminal domain-containing protein n=2 Tax=Plectus sambesii TaxID=2011161 RepID=A0A914WDB8_9BILA